MFGLNLVNVKIYSDNTITYSNTANYTRDAQMKYTQNGYYTRKYKMGDVSRETRLIVNTNWDSILVSEIDGQGVGSSRQYPRVTLADPCAQLNEFKLCKGDLLAGDGVFRNAMSNAARRVTKIFLNLAGELVMFESTLKVEPSDASSGLLSPAGVLQAVAQVDFGVKCLKKICVGQQFDYLFLDRTTAKVEVLGFMKSQVVYKPLESKFILFEAGSYYASKLLPIRGFSKKFEKTLSVDCDDLSPNQKEALFTEAGTKASQTCEKESGLHGCYAEKFCDSSLGCGYKNWIDRSVKGSCKIFGYTVPYISGF